MLDDVGEAETTEDDQLLQSVLALGEVGLREGLAGDDSGVDSCDGGLVALVDPHFNIEVLPLVVGLGVVRHEVLRLGAQVVPVCRFERL